MHATLTPKNNIRLIVTFAIVCGLVIAFGSVPLLPYIIGAAFGAMGGFLQLRAIRRSRSDFLSAGDAFAVRRALASSSAGKIYLVVFWLGAIVFVAVSVTLLRERFFLGWLAAYCCFVVVRDLIALPATFELQRRESSSGDSTRAI
jgi:hypothetical protein